MLQIIMAVEQKGGEALIEDDYQYVNTLDHGTVLPWATAESWARGLVNVPWVLHSRSGG